ncbi:MAG: SxtJ family membrane protein [Candidatus Latescibacterota bacterium]
MTERSEGWWGVPTPQRKDLRNFAFVMAVAALLLSGVLWYTYRTEGMQIAWMVAGGFVGVGLVLPTLLKPLFFVWMALARLLSIVNTHLLLALIFYTLFTLIGGVMRIVRYDPLDRKRSSGQATYWHRRETPLLNRKHYERQF